MTKYEEITDSEGVVTIKRENFNGSVSFIPADESNGDYQAYLRWLENPDADESGTL